MEWSDLERKQFDQGRKGANLSPPPLAQQHLTPGWAVQDTAAPAVRYEIRPFFFTFARISLRASSLSREKMQNMHMAKE